jgi:hypothetical protein
LPVPGTQQAARAGTGYARPADDTDPGGNAVMAL